MPHTGHGRSTIHGARGTTTPRNPRRVTGLCANRARYRVVATAQRSLEQSGPKRIAFRVVKG
jgi:hypothetical protein